MKFFAYRKMLKELNIDDIDAHIKAIKLREGKLNKRQVEWRKFGVLCKFFLPKKITSLKGDEIILGPPESAEKAEQYIRDNNKNDHNFYSYNFSILKNIKIPNRIRSSINRAFFKILLISLFDFRSNSSYIFNIYKVIVSFTNRRDVKKLYILGRLYSAQYYLTALILSEYCGIHVDYIIDSGFIFINKRFTALRMCNVICGSDVQRKEILSLNKMGLFQYKSLKKWGTITDVPFCQEKQFIYDIGIYSSGEWARRNGMWQTGDIKGIRKYSYIDNYRYRLFEEVLQAVIQNFGNVKICIYLHPYERLLMNEHNIFPPYLEGISKKSIVVDSEKGSSLEKIFEVKIGITLRSTISYERLENGLPCYFLNFAYFNPESSFKPEYLGKYARFVYSTSKELIDKIRKDFDGED